MESGQSERSVTQTDTPCQAQMPSARDGQPAVVRRPGSLCSVRHSRAPGTRRAWRARSGAQEVSQSHTAALAGPTEALAPFWAEPGLGAGPHGAGPASPSRQPPGVAVAAPPLPAGRIPGLGGREGGSEGGWCLRGPPAAGSHLCQLQVPAGMAGRPGMTRQQDSDRDPEPPHPCSRLPLPALAPVGGIAFL